MKNQIKNKVGINAYKAKFSDPHSSCELQDSMLTTRKFITNKITQNHLVLLTILLLSYTKQIPPFKVTSSWPNNTDINHAKKGILLRMMWYFFNLLLKLDHTLITLSILFERHWHNKDLKKFKRLKKKNVVSVLSPAANRECRSYQFLQYDDYTHCGVKAEFFDWKNK